MYYSKALSHHQWRVGRRPLYSCLAGRHSCANRFLAMHKCTSCPHSVIRVKSKAFDIWLKVFSDAKVQVEEPSLPYFRSHYRTVAGGYSCEAGSLTSLLCKSSFAYALCNCAYLDFEEDSCYSLRCSIQHCGYRLEVR